MNNVDLKKEVKRLVDSNHYEIGYVCAVDILLRLGYLTKDDYEDWRFGRIDYHEKVCKVNLGKLTFINKLIGKAWPHRDVYPKPPIFVIFSFGMKQAVRMKGSQN